MNILKSMFKLIWKDIKSVIPFMLGMFLLLLWTVWLPVNYIENHNLPRPYVFFWWLGNLALIAVICVIWEYYKKAKWVVLDEQIK